MDKVFLGFDSTMRNVKISLTLISFVLSSLQTSTNAFSTVNHALRAAASAQAPSSPRGSFFVIASSVVEYEKQSPSIVGSDDTSTRRSFLLQKGVAVSLMALAVDLVSSPYPAHAAKAECMTDCEKNCKLIAPKVSL